MKKLYISGKITGIPIETAVELFKKAESMIKELGYEPVSPLAEVDLTKTWEEHMLNDIAALFQCDGIYMLSNYFSSTGARIERHIAVEMGKIVVYEK